MAKDYTIRLQKRFVEYGQLHDEFKKEVLSQSADLTIDIAKKSLRRAPKGVLKARAAGKPFLQQDQRVTTTFKSGRRKGQTREFTRRGFNSAPGSPPRHHAPGNGGLRSMTRAFLNRDEIQYGPKGFTDSWNAQNANASLPYVHEAGGTFTFTVSFKRQKKKLKPQPDRKKKKSGSDWQRIKEASDGPKKTPYLPAISYGEKRTYPARPFMTPAQAKGRNVLMRKVRNIARGIR